MHCNGTIYLAILTIDRNYENFVCACSWTIYLVILATGQNHDNTMLNKDVEHFLCDSGTGQNDEKKEDNMPEIQEKFIFHLSTIDSRL